MSKIGLTDSPAAHIIVTRSSTNNKWLLTWLPTFLGIALAMILIPFFLLFVNKIITLAWRHHKRCRDGAQIQDFRNWYSLVGFKNHPNHTRHRKSRWSVVLNKLGIKHIPTNYAAWFWAPEEPQLVTAEELDDAFPARYSSPGWPSRLGSRLRRNAPSTTRNTDHELEEGMSRYSLAEGQNIRFEQTPHGTNHARRFSSHHTDSVPTMSGALAVPGDLENMSTVRRRHVMNGRPWFSHTNNEGISKATSEELGIIISGQGNGGSSQDFQAFPSPHRNQSFTTQLDRLKSIATRRINSMPIISALSKLRHDHQESREQHLSPQKPSIPEFYRSRDSYNLHVPTNSEDTSTLTPLCRKNTTSRTKRSKSTSVLDASKTCYDQDLVDNIDDRLKWLVFPKENDYSKRIGSKYCGTSGRLGSPITAYACGSTSPIMFLDDMSAYEAESSLDGAVSRRESTASIRMDMLHLSQYRKVWDNLPISDISSLSKSMPPLRSSHLLDRNTIHSSLSPFATPTAKAPSATPTSTLKPFKRKRAVDRGIHVSMQKDPENEREDLDASRSFMSFPVVDSGPEDHQNPLMKHTSDKRTDLHAPSLLSITHMKTENLEMPSTPPNGVAVVQNKYANASLNFDQKDSPFTIKDSFVQSLHTKLDRLHYELSPGFRSPAPAHWKIIDENVPIWSQGPHKLSMPSTRRKHQTQNGRTLRRSTLSLQDLPPETTSFSAELSSWRVKLNHLRCRTGLDQLHSCVPATLLPDTGIATAAYILRQPPDGIGPDPAAATALYLGAFGRARTLSHWQHGPAALTIKKRASSHAALPTTPPRKTQRRTAPMVTVRLKRDGGVWRPLGFGLPAAVGQLDAGVENRGEGVEGRVERAVGSGEQRGG